MLVLSRKVDESIVIGPDITITVLRVDGGKVRLGVEAPKNIKVLRRELPDTEHLRVINPKASGLPDTDAPATNLNT